MFEPALRPDPLIRTLLGKKMPSSGHLDEFLKLEGRPGPVQTNLVQMCLDKNPIFGIRPFLLLPGVLLTPNKPLTLVKGQGFPRGVSGVLFL